MNPTYTDKKQTWEKWKLSLSATNSLSTGDTISSIEVKAFDSAGTDVTSTLISGTPSFSGTTITAWVQAGTSGSNYNIRVRITTTVGELIEDDLLLVVKDEN